ncbi:MAG: hypothetical protein RIQ56_514 [Candidatus Parcubacteria bacterium]|jgi:hypothetical protein
MFGLSSSSKKSEVIAIVDVGSGSAAVGIIQLHDSQPAMILASNRASLSFEERTESQTIAAVATAIKTAGVKALEFYRSQKDQKPPTKLYIFLRVPWSRSKAIEMRQKLDEETVISDKMVSALAKQALTEEKDIDSKNLLEAAVIHIMLNGYRVVNIKGKRAHTLNISVLLSDSHESLKIAVQDAALSVFPSLTPQWRTHTRALVKILSRNMDEWRNCVVFDVGTEGTSISVIRKGMLAEQVTLPEGSRAILHKISRQGMPEETLALLALLEREQSGPATEGIRASIANAEPELIRVFGEQFSRLASPRRLPNKLLLIAHPDLAPLLAQFLSRIDFAQFTITAQPFSVLPLDANHLGRHLQAAKGAVPDPSFSIAAAFVNIDEHE